jgi:hypothetical protein
MPCSAQAAPWDSPGGTSMAAVEKHVTNIFHKLRLAPAAGGHRRVLAVLRYLQGSADTAIRLPQ